jgi:hypothetical protein
VLLPVMYEIYTVSDFVSAPNGFYWEVTNEYKTIIEKQNNLISFNLWESFIDLHNYRPTSATLFYGPIPTP